MNFETISKIFTLFLSGETVDEKRDHLSHLILSNIKANKILWKLEDSARMSELGDQYVAKVKRDIDRNNQVRSDLIREIDIEFSKQLSAVNKPNSQFYSESPGMIIDRLSIIFLKLFAIRELLKIIIEEGLKEEYLEKEKIVYQQMLNLGKFLNLYILKLNNGDIFFEVQQPVKIYNDERIKKYIRALFAEEEKE